MLGTEKLKLSTNELDQALDLSIEGGKKCHTLGELVEFVTKLVVDDEVLRRLDPTSEYPEIEPHRWWFRGARSDHNELDAGLFRILVDDAWPVSGTEQ
jgi:hypothetical protein